MMKSHYTAAEEFRRLRSRAAFQEFVARFTGQPTELLSYEEVRQKLRASGVTSESIQEVPLKAIVGSVGRYTDFTRTFLPRRNSDMDRWVRIMVATDGLAGLPPVELLLIDEVYFVSDGHHRVSVANEIGSDTIQAYVTEIRSEIPLSADVSREDLILKAEYADFLNATQFTKLRPEADLTVSTAGQYRKLLEHIHVHRYFMGLDLDREISFSEAATHWYDKIYLPIAILVRDMGILFDFPERTEADLYLWISKHRAEISEKLNWDVNYEVVALDLVKQKEPRWRQMMARLGGIVIDVDSPVEISADSGKAKDTLVGRKAPGGRNLFNDILVPISGQEISWIALDQALSIAGREDGRVLGLHVISEDIEGDEVQIGDVEGGFYWRCGEKDIAGSFAIDQGPIAQTICKRGRWADLIVVKLQYPPGSSALSRFSSGMAKMIRQCSRPILAVAGEVSELSKPLLLWDDSKYSELALLVAVYVAGQWNLPVVVLTGEDDENNSTTRIHWLIDSLAPENLSVTYRNGDISSTQEILRAAGDNSCDWIISPGYGSSALKEIVLGTTLDDLLGRANIPLLICQ
jgi:nucleotide-binding universal stress UspA family protein